MNNDKIENLISTVYNGGIRLHNSEYKYYSYTEKSSYYDWIETLFGIKLEKGKFHYIGDSKYLISYIRDISDIEIEIYLSSCSKKSTKKDKVLKIEKKRLAAVHATHIR